MIEREPITVVCSTKAGYAIKGHIETDGGLKFKEGDRLASRCAVKPRTNW